VLWHGLVCEELREWASGTGALLLLLLLLLLCTARLWARDTCCQAVGRGDAAPRVWIKM